MSLTSDQLRIVSNTLLEDLERTGLSHQEVAHDLNFSEQRLASTLRMSRRADATDVWLVRDYLHQAALDATGSAAVHTVLTEKARRSAQTWFGLKAAPHHDFPQVPRDTQEV